MDLVIILLPLALIIAGLMLGLFVWAVRSGQYDDLETPAVRMLFDDAPPAASEGRLPGPSRSPEAPLTDPSTPRERDESR